MAAGTAATAAGALILLYYVLSRRLVAKGGEDGDLSKSRSGRRKIARRPAQAPATWLETITTLSETLRFTYSETLGKWPIGDLAFGINYLMRRQVGLSRLLNFPSIFFICLPDLCFELFLFNFFDLICIRLSQGNLPVASVYAGGDSVQLTGPEIIAELNSLLRLLTLCMFFSKKPFPVFLDSAGYSLEDVLLQKPKAGVSKLLLGVVKDATYLLLSVEYTFFPYLKSKEFGTGFS